MEGTAALSEGLGKAYVAVVRGGGGTAGWWKVSDVTHARGKPRIVLPRWSLACALPNRLSKQQTVHSIEEVHRT